MKYQKGFIPVVVAIIAIAAIAMGGGYALYKSHQGIKTSVAIENTQQVVQGTGTPENIVPPTETKSAVAADTKVACGNDANCLISAAAQCQTATGSIARDNIEHPLFPGLFVSVKNTFSMKKSGSICMLNQHSAIQSASLSAEGRAALLGKGMTAAEIDEEVKVVSDSMKKEGVIDSVCKTDNATAVSYFTDLKNKYIGDTSSHATFGSSSTTITTSTGHTLTCTS